mgnify:CR=1 FL=1
MMAQRKDMMRIIRQDAGFSAKLGFGGSVGASDQAGRVIPVQSTSVDAVTEQEPLPPAIATAAAMPSGDAGEVSIRPFGSKEESRDEKKVFIAQRASDAKAAGLATGSAARGHVVHVSLSLATELCMNLGDGI